VAPQARLTSTELDALSTDLIDDANGKLEPAKAMTRRSSMTQPPGAQPVPQPTPLTSAERARAEVNFSPYVIQTLLSRGRFRVSADTPEMVELFQNVARRVGDTLRRPVVSYANGREIVITFGHEDLLGLTGYSPTSLGA
jgi:hypothetical protein